MFPPQLLLIRWRFAPRPLGFPWKFEVGGFIPMYAQLAKPVGNWLLDSLAFNDYERLGSHLEPVAFSLGAVVYESGGQMDHVFFPTTSHVSLLYTMVNGATAEMGLVGNEGVVGIAL